MTVSVQETRFPQVANGVTVDFPFGCLIPTASDIVVTIDDVVVTTGFTVSGLGNASGGVVTFSTAPANGAVVVVERIVALKRDTDYQQTGDFLSKVVNPDFDRVWMALQQLETIIGSAFGAAGRVLKLGRSDVNGSGSYRAQQNRIQDLADPLNNQDAVNKRSMLAEIARVSSVIAGTLGTFVQNGAGAIVRTFLDKQRDTVSVRDFVSTSIDGVTSNQAGIAAAVAYAYSTGALLYWPAGLYVSDDTIPNFHDVQHFGPGRIKRNIDTWTISGKNATNVIYVAKTGNDSNDGLSALKPKLTAQSAFDALKNWATALLNDGVFRLQFGIGTWTESASLVGLRSKNRIEFLGANVGSHPNVPTTIINGTGQGTVGWYFQQYMLTKVQNIKFTNWSIHGLLSELHSNLWTVNVHTAGNGWNDTSNGSGIDAESNSRIYVSGGIHNNTGNTVRLYANCVGTIGYQGTDTTNRPQITGATGGNAGVLVRDNSSAHIDYSDITGCSGSGGGVYGLNQARIHIMNSTVTGNYYNVRLDANSTYINTGSTISGATTGKDVAQFGMSMDNTNLTAWYFDPVNVRWRLGNTSNLSPQAMLHLISGAGAVGASYNTNSRQIIESDADALLSFGTPGGSTEAGITAAKPAGPLQGKLVYSYSDDTWRVTLNSAENYRFSGAAFLPTTDNARTLGGSGNRWSTVYAGTGAINTSDEREKTPAQPIDNATLRAWAKVNYCQFKFKDAIEKKGNSARWHFGVIAQRVKEAFESEGLDPFAYGVLCYDEWPETVEEWPDEFDTEGNLTREAGRIVKPAGNRYGIRYEEALVLECAYLRSRLAA